MKTRENCLLTIAAYPYEQFESKLELHAFNYHTHLLTLNSVS